MFVPGYAMGPLRIEDFSNFIILDKTPEKSNPTHKTGNDFNHGKDIYFVCDVPHLIKTTRNNLENAHGHLNSKNLMKNKKSINWTHIVGTFEEDSSRSLGKLPRIKTEHIRLSPQLRMRVRLALSSSMGHAILSRGIPEMTETANFCLIFDKWFDCLNARYLVEGVRKRNENLMPYKDSQDVRLQWLETSFWAGCKSGSKRWEL